MSQKPLLKRIIKWVIGIPVALLVILFIIALFAPETPERVENKSNVADASSEGVDYKVLNREEFSTTNKANISVELKEPINEEELHVISRKIKEEEGDSFERIYIAYYLAKTMPGYAYAVTNFEGDEAKLVTFNGATEDQIKQLKSASMSEGTLVGDWIEPAFIGQRITIYKKGESYFLKQLYKDGSKEKVKAEKMIRGKGSNASVRFEYPESPGDYFEILNNKDLGIFNKEGKQFAVAFQIK